MVMGMFHLFVSWKRWKWVDGVGDDCVRDVDSGWATVPYSIIAGERACDNNEFGPLADWGDDLLPRSSPSQGGDRDSNSLRGAFDIPSKNGGVWVVEPAVGVSGVGSSPQPPGG